MDIIDRKIQLTELLELIRSVLDEKQYDIFYGRIFHDMTLQSLANEYNCCIERIRQIEALSLKRIRKALSNHPEIVNDFKMEFNV